MGIPCQALCPAWERVDIITIIAGRRGLTAQSGTVPCLDDVRWSRLPGQQQLVLNDFQEGTHGCLNSASVQRTSGSESDAGLWAVSDGNRFVQCSSVPYDSTQ